MCSQRFSQAQSNLQASGSHGDKCCEAPPAAPKSIASWDSNGIPTKFQRCGCRQHFFHSTLELVSRWQVATHLRTERAACGKRGLFHWLVPRPSVGRPFGTTNHRAAAVPTVGVNILKISKKTSWKVNLHDVSGHTANFKRKRQITDFMNSPQE